MVTEAEAAGYHRSAVGDVVANPVFQTLFSMAAISVAMAAGLAGGKFDLAPLHAPIYDPWAGAVVSIYAHSSLELLLANATVVAATGLLLSRYVSRANFHLFFLLAGTTSALVHIHVTGLVGPASGGIGASGAALALVGYLFTGTVRPASALRRMGVLPALGVVVGLALVVILFLSEPGGAYFAHGTGLAIGIAAGQYDLLQKD